MQDSSLSAPTNGSLGSSSQDMLLDFSAWETSKDDNIIAVDQSPLYVQIMEVCQPFYGSPNSGGSASFHIPPRLEDGLADPSLTVGQQENPQDASNCC
jgi:hypothetical protein